MRRRILCVAVALGALAWIAAPALSLEPYAPKVAEFAVTPASTGVVARAAGAGDVVLPVVRAPGRFDLVGVTWRDRGEVHAWLRVRRDGGRWSRWLEPGHADGDGRSTAPLLTPGGADEVQVRLERRPRGLRLRFVNTTGTADRRAQLVTKLRRGIQSAVMTAAGTSAVAARARTANAPAMVGREQWDPAGQCRPRDAPAYGEVKAAIVHHTVSSNLYGPQDGPAMVLAICRYHRTTNGWSDIGYNALVDRYGRLYEGRAGGIDRPVIGAHAQGVNRETTGVANLGDFSAAGQSEEALRAMARFIAYKLGVSGAATQGTATIRSSGGSQSRFPAGRNVVINVVSGHRDVGATDCPGGGLYAQLPPLRQYVAEAPAGIPPAPGAPATPAPIPTGAVTLQAPNLTVPYGRAAQVGGRATTNDGGPLGGAEIRVQVRTAARWQTVTRATSGPDGGWVAELTARRTREVRALAYLAGRRAATSTPLAITVPSVIEARAARRVVVGLPLTVTGRIQPAKTRVMLTIARQGRDGAFRTVARIAVRPRGGGFRSVTRLSRPALYRLRVTSAGDRRHAPARSADLVLRAIRPRAARGGAAVRTR